MFRVRRRAGDPQHPQHTGVYAPGTRRRAAWLTVPAVVAALAAGAVASTTSAAEQVRGADAAPERIDPDAPNIRGEKVYRGLGREHRSGRIAYPARPVPPVGGPHNPVWQNADGAVYDRPLRNEHAVHSLEHGTVWVTYAPDAPASGVRALRKQVEGVPYRMMSPVPKQGAPFELTAWGHQLSLRSGTDERAAQFLEAYTQGPQTPEAGAPATGGRKTP